MITLITIVCDCVGAPDDVKAKALAAFTSKPVSKSLEETYVDEGDDVLPLTDNEKQQLDDLVEAELKEHAAFASGNSDNLVSAEDQYDSDNAAEWAALERAKLDHINEFENTEACPLTEEEEAALGVFAHPSGVYIPADCDEALRIKAERIQENAERDPIAQSASDMAKEDYSDDCSECGSSRCMGDCTSTRSEVPGRFHRGEMNPDFDELGQNTKVGDDNIAMAEAGMTYEEIATVNHIESLYAEVDKAKTALTEARDCIGGLLAQLDEAIGVEMHWYGWTPSWYVEAAAISCGVNLAQQKPVVITGQELDDLDDEEEESPTDQLIAERFLHSKSFKRAWARRHGAKRLFT